uniref:Pleckstrin homology domain-containing protein n=1 Tax=Anopheles epiroticus TaxID=199890 RepID=A0A182PQ72_9DIPT
MPRADGLYRSGSGKILQQGEDYPVGGSQSMPRPSATDRGGSGVGQGSSRHTVSSLKKQASGSSHQQQQEQFARSASARLPRKEEDSSLRDGERKREESMKRLLEWKQRMLQSPLTKKIASQHAATMASAESLNRSGGGGDRRHEDIYGMKADESMLRDYYAATYERQSVGDLTAIGSAAGVAARKHGGSAVNIAQASAYGSEMKLNGDYNSYSSDDEGVAEAPPQPPPPLPPSPSPPPPPPPPPSQPTPPPPPPHNLTQHNNHCPPYGRSGSSTDNPMHALTHTFYADTTGSGGGGGGEGGGGGGGGGDGKETRISRKDANDGNSRMMMKMVEQKTNPVTEHTIVGQQGEEHGEDGGEVEDEDEEEEDGVYEDSLVNHASVSASPNLSVDANVYENSFIKGPLDRRLHGESVESDEEKLRQRDERATGLPGFKDGNNRATSDIHSSNSSMIGGSGNNNNSLLEDKSLSSTTANQQGDRQLQSYVPVYKHSLASLTVQSLQSGPVTHFSNEVGKTAPKESQRQEEIALNQDMDAGNRHAADDAEDAFEYTDEDLDEALQQAEQQAEAQSPKEKPSAEQLARQALDEELSLQIMEGHYMPMTPRRTVISTASSCTTLSLMNYGSATLPASTGGGKLRPCESLTAMDILDSIQKGNEMQMCNAYDESTYIEMTKGTHGKSVFAMAEELRGGGTTYEMIMVPEPSSRSGATNSSGSGMADRALIGGKHPATVESEPLYMELSQLHSSSKEPGKRDSKGQDNGLKGTESGEGGPTETALAGEKTSTMVRMKNAMTGSTGKRKKKDKNWPDIVMQSSRTDDSDSESDSADKLAEECKRVKKKTVGKEKKQATIGSDLQSKTMARSRFSLSDTFRPASYYLGASGSSNSTPFDNGSTFDILLDSSDSDIVSPPPIPISSLPLDEPDSGGGHTLARYGGGDREKFRSSEAIDLIKHHHAQQEKRQSVQSLVVAGTSSGGPSLAGSMNLSYGMRRESGSISSNRSSLRSSGVIGKLGGPDRYDGVSHASSDYELLLREPAANNGGRASMGGIPDGRDRNSSARSSITLSEASGSIEWRSRSCMDVSMRNKRRPISGSSINCPIELALEGCELASAEVERYSQSGGGIESNSNPSNFSQNGHDNSIYYENVELTGSHASSESLSRNSTVPVLSPLREKNLSLHDARCQSEYLGTVLEGHSLDVENASLSSAMDPDQQSSCTLRGEYDRTNACNRTITPIDGAGSSAPLHSRNNSTLSSEGAPYYYSDLQVRARDEDVRDTPQHSRQASSGERYVPGGGDTLNNQRDPGGLRKPTTGSIFHIHNPLNTLKAANLLLHASANEKHADIDRKNIYESERMGQKDVNKTIAASLAAGGGARTVGRSSSSLGAPNEGTNVRQSTGSLGNNHQPQYGADGAFSLRTGDPEAAAPSSRRDSMHQQADTSAGSNISSGDQLWEEDTLWRDNLRRVSHIHAKSMDNLDHLGTIRSPSAALLVKTINQQQQQQDAARQELQQQQFEANCEEPSNQRPIVKINRKDVTYVNEHLAHLPLTPAGANKSMLRSSETQPPLTRSLVQRNTTLPGGEAVVRADCNGDDDDVYVQLASNVSSTGTIVRDGRWSSSSGRESESVYEVLRDEINRYDINRETIRQWDLMSSGLVNSSNMAVGSSTSKTAGSISDTYQKTSVVNSVSSAATTGKTNALSAMENASETITFSGTGTYRSLKAKQYLTEPCEKTNDGMPGSGLNGGKHNNGETSISVRNVFNLPKVALTVKPDPSDPSYLQAAKGAGGGGVTPGSYYEGMMMGAAAADYYGSDNPWMCLLNLIRTAEGNRKADSLARLDALKQQLTELEKQYEKEKPLINLVDNMVKLGSLYRGPVGGKKQLQSPESATLDRLEFNQRMQERRLLQEEQRQWDRTSPNHVELQSKVQQLYQIDKLMQEESGTLQALQRDKENLEKALATLKTRVLNREGGANMPMAMDTARQQQHTLERELTRVHQLLAANSKKLEKTVSTNARLEQELLVLRQKLQASREHRSMHSVFDPAAAMDHQYMPGSVTAVLESELKRAKLLVGDMQRQRQELGQAVRQLTSYGEQSDAQLMTHHLQPEHEQHLSHSQEQQREHQQSGGSKHKRSYSSSWVETDLDSMAGKESSSAASSSNHHRALSSSTSSVLTIDDEMQHLFLPGSRTKDPSDGVESMDELYSAESLYNYGAGTLNAADKQEIKTVRIVKRESERRMRDKEKNDRNLALSLDQVLEEEAQLMEDYQRSKSLPRGYETHELFVQSHGPGADGVIGGVGATSMDGHKLMSDYYSSVVASTNGNSYPVSLIDRQADLYTGNFETGLQSKYLTGESGAMSGRASGAGSVSYQSNNPYLTSGGTGMSASSLGGLKRKTESIQSLTNTEAELDPVFQSEAAKQIINEMATGGNMTVGGEHSGDSSGSGESQPPPKDDQQYQQQQQQQQRQAQQNRQRRAVPKDKRRHHTAPHHVNAKSIELMHSENDMNKNNVNWRARDDVDLEVTIRPRSNAPDVVRSALGPREKISEHTIDKLLAAPSKILIPERYVPEQTPELSPEEKRRRQEKVEAIKKMLSDTPIGGGAGSNETGVNPVPNAEKKQREHLIQLNQILAQQVMQMSKIVAENSSAVLPSKIKRKCNNAQQMGANGTSAVGGKPNDDRDHYESDLEDYDTDSPAEPLPLYQQRENYFT